jgi:hypothetical protein
MWSYTIFLLNEVLLEKPYSSFSSALGVVIFYHSLG